MPIFFCSIKLIDIDENRNKALTNWRNPRFDQNSFAQKFQTLSLAPKIYCRYCDDNDQ